jgi:hypothetical protein
VRRTSWLPAALFGIFALAVISRGVMLGRVREDNLTPDGARFLNLARCLSRGEGFSTPEAWPAWLSPARLPTAETFKEPGYSSAIAAITPVVGAPFRAGQWISLIAGLLIPWVVFQLGRRFGMDGTEAAFAAGLAALSPLLIQQSALVMAESLFTLIALMALLAAVPRVAPAGRRAAGALDAPARATVIDAGAGIFFGLAFLVRAQGVLLLPAMLPLLARGRSPEVALRRVALAGLGAAVAIAPLVVRNLREFGTPFHSDVAAFGLWPYTDLYALTHILNRPPGALSFALHHLPQIIGQIGGSVWRFGRYTLPHDLLGHWVLLLPLAAGSAITLRRWRIWGPVLAAVAIVSLFLFATHWVARYFAMITPLLAMLCALGMARMFRALRVLSPGALRLVATIALAVAFAAGAAISLARTWRDGEPVASGELIAARAAAPWLRAHLSHEDAVMGEVTSYWAWFSDRPAVHPVIADSVRFEAVLDRLHVRVAAFSDTALAQFIAHSPGRRLPSALIRVPEREVPGVHLFRVATR